MFIWTIADAVGLTVLFLLIILGLIHVAKKEWKQARCSHERTRLNVNGEVCQDCDKNLGYPDKEK